VETRDMKVVAMYLNTYIYSIMSLQSVIKPLQRTSIVP
jgi:hypothetical protein